MALAQNKTVNIVGSTLAVRGRLETELFLAAQSLTGPNTLVELEVPNLNELVAGLNHYQSQGSGWPGSTGNSFSILNWSQGAECDAFLGKFPLIQTSHGTVTSEAYKTVVVTYDEFTNAVTSVRNPWGVYAGHGYGANLALNGKAYKFAVTPNGFTDGNFACLPFDLVNNTHLPVMPTAKRDIDGGAGGNWEQVQAGCSIPDLGPEGSLMHLNENGCLNRYDVETEGWTNIIVRESLGGALNPNTGEPHMHYNPVSKLMIIGDQRAGGRFWTVNQAGTPLASNADQPSDIYAGKIFIPAPNSIDSLLFANGGNVHPVDTMTRAWKTPITVPEPLASDPRFPEFATAWSVPAYNCILIVLSVDDSTNKMFVWRYQ